MKKFILFLTVSIRIFSIEGSVGIGNINTTDKYTGKEENIIVPTLNLKHGGFYFRGTELGFNTKKENTEYGTSLQFSFGGNLEPKDVEYKIVEERKAPLYLGFYGKQKVLNGGNIELKYQKEFQSSGDILSLSYSQFVKLNLPLLFIPYIKYSIRDKDYSNYYLGLRENEVAYWNTAYKNLDNSSKLDLGFTSTLFLTKKMSLSMVYNKEFLDDNKSLLVKENDSRSFIASLIYKF